MKKLVFRLLLGALTFLLAFLIGAFTEASLNIKEWSDMSRQMVGMIGGILAISAITFPNYEFHTF